MNRKKKKVNPFLDALPKRLTKKQFFKQFISLPEFKRTQIHKMSVNERNELLDDILLEYREPFDIHWHIYGKLEDCLRIGYKARPAELFLPTIDLIEEWRVNKNNKNWNPPKSIIKHIPSCSLIGISGVGKSTAVDEGLSVFPQTIFHEDLNKIQVTYLKVTCPSKGSSKGLCMEIIRQMDKVAKTKYTAMYDKSSLTEYNLIAAISTLVHNHALGLLVVDEIQQLKVAKGEGQETLLNFLKVINEIVAVPIFYIGTSQALRILNANFQIGRRSKGIGRILWDRFSEDSGDWVGMVDSLWEMQVISTKNKLTDEIRFVYYDETQGITDLLLTLHICVQKWALENKIMKITPEFIRSVAHEEFAGLQDMIKALRSKDYDEIKKYPDIYMDPAMMAEYEERTKSTFELDQPDVEKLIELIKKSDRKLIDKDISNHATLISEVYSDCSLKVQLKHLRKYLTNLSKAKKKNTASKKGKPSGLLIDLAKKAKKEGLDLHDIIKDAGLTLKLKDFLKF